MNWAKAVKAGRANPRFFIERFLWIVDKASRLVRLTLNTPQQRLYAVISRCWAEGRPVRLLVLKARQEGVSTLCEAVMFARTALFPNVRSYIVAHDLDGSDKIFAMSKLFHDLLPEPIKPMTRYSNRKELVFENPDDHTRGANPGLRSRFTVETANRVKLGRGDTLQNFHGSEIAYWEHPGEVMLAVKQAIPDHPGTMIVLESTANGIGNYFHREWQRATAGETDFLPLFIPWFDLPDYSRPLEVSRRKFTESLTEEEQRLRERHRLTLEQLCWRRWAIQNKCDGSPEKFLQEYPDEAETAFLVSGRPVFNPLILRALLDACKDPVAVGTLRPEGSRVNLEANPKGFLKVWRRPEVGHSYIIGADSAEGLEKGDYSCAQVLDRRDLALVASWWGHTAADLFGEELARLGTYYKQAFLGVEAENHGLTVLTALKRLGYPKLYYRQQVGTVGEKVTDRLGWSTNTRTKPLMIDATAKALREGSIRIHDKATVEELLTYVVNPDGTTSAQEGCFDDRVMALAIALQMHAGAGLATFFPALG